MTARNGSAAFVDTNILIYVCKPADPPFWVWHNRFVDELISSERLRTSTQVLQEFFAVSTRKMRIKLTMARRSNTLKIGRRFPVVLIDYPTIRKPHILARIASFPSGIA